MPWSRSPWAHVISGSHGWVLRRVGYIPSCLTLLTVLLALSPASTSLESAWLLVQSIRTVAGNCDSSQRRCDSSLTSPTTSIIVIDGCTYFPAFPPGWCTATTRIMNCVWSLRASVFRGPSSTFLRMLFAFSTAQSGRDLQPNRC